MGLKCPPNQLIEKAGSPDWSSCRGTILESVFPECANPWRCLLCLGNGGLVAIAGVLASPKY